MTAIAACDTLAALLSSSGAEDQARESASNATASASAVVVAMGMMRSDSTGPSGLGLALASARDASPAADEQQWSLHAAASLLASRAVDVLWASQSLAWESGSGKECVLLSRGFNPKQCLALLAGALGLLAAGDWVREARIAGMLGRGKVLLGAIERELKGGKQLAAGAAAGSSSGSAWPVGLREWICFDLLGANDE